MPGSSSTASHRQGREHVPAALPNPTGLRPERCSRLKPATDRWLSVRRHGDTDDTIPTGNIFMPKCTTRTEEQLSFDFSAERAQISTEEMESPSGYTGFYRFHKYWGKKPHEPLAYIIEQLTSPGDTVLDPFCGSGTAGRETLLRSRKFIGFDINPVALEITRLLVHPPPPSALRNAVRHLEEAAKPEILKSYVLEDKTSVATHYLWNGNELEKVWLVRRGAAGRRQELVPTAFDKSLCESFAEYHSTLIRKPRFFTNSRINAAPEMTLDDVLTAAHSVTLTCFFGR